LVPQSNPMIHRNIDSNQEIVRTGIGKQLDLFLERATNYGFVGSILISKQGKIILQKGYGLANADRNIPFTHETIVDIGSLSKQFTASAILYLEQQGLLSVQDSISQFFDDVPKEKQEITLHHLLTHTSGLPLKHGSDFEYYETERFITDALALPLAFTPGTEYKYSNPAFALLAIIIEQLTQQTLQSFLTTTFFEPLGLEKIGWYGTPTWSEEEVAQVYVEGVDGGSPLSWPGPYRPLLGNGGICCPINELYRWMQAIKTNVFLTKESTTKLFTPFLEDTSYGWDVLQTKYGPRIWHNGGTDSGANSELTWFRDLDLLLIAFSNHILFGEDVGYMAIWPIRSILFKNPYILPPPAPNGFRGANNLAQFIGNYTFPQGGEINITTQSDFLILSLRGQPILDFCLFPNEGPPQEYEFYDKTSNLLIDGLFEDDFTILQNYVMNKNRIPLLVSLLRRWIHTSQESFGSYRTHEILGSAPFKEFFDATWLHFDFEEGQNGLGVVWKDKQLVRITETYYPYPVIIPFLRKTDTEFIGHSILFNQTLELTYEKEDAISGFHIHNGTSSVFIPKLPS
jgi:CubicO group peptidase (beta-lactamase class C family)